MARKTKKTNTSCVPLRDEVIGYGTLTGMTPNPYEKARNQRFVSNGDSDAGGRDLKPDATRSRAAEGGTQYGSGGFGDSPPTHLTVKELAQVTGVKVGAIYEFISTEPDFPVVNKGVRKKYMIDPVQFEIWLAGRTAKQRHRRFGVPSDLDMQKLFKGKQSGGAQ